MQFPEATHVGEAAVRRLFRRQIQHCDQYVFFRNEERRAAESGIVIILFNSRTIITTSISSNLSIRELLQYSRRYRLLLDWITFKFKNDKYVFSKRHEGKKEIYLESYLEKFISSNVNINKIVS